MNVKTHLLQLTAVLALGLSTVSTIAEAQTSPTRTIRFLKNEATGLCAQIGYDANETQVIYTIQPCDRANAAQWFFVFEGSADTDLKNFSWTYPARVLGAANHIYDSTNSAVFSGANWSEMSAPIGENLPAGSTPLYKKWGWSYQTPANAFLLRNLQTGYCLSYAYHNPAPGTRLSSGTCDPNYDKWTAPQIFGSAP